MGNDIFSAVIELNKIRQQAYEIYLPIVEELCNREVSEEELSHCLDYLLDFADDASMLELYKKLCRRFVYTYPGCINFMSMPIKRCGKNRILKGVYMNQLIKMDEEYRKWIEDIGKRYKQRQIKASVSVNQEMIGFYWSIGRDIVEKSAESKWGSGFLLI